MTTEESGAGRRRGPVVAAFACALVTLAVDQASKQWALDDLGDGRTVRVLGRFLTFTLHFNPGAAFSFGTGATWVFTAVSCAVVLALPFVIARSRSAPWAIALGVVWGGAAAGIAMSLVWPGAPRWLRTALYIVLGWVAVWFLPQFWREGGPAIVWLLVAGGVTYTLGAVVYARKTPDPSPHWFGFHEIFHVCTVAAWACQCVACFLAVVR